MGMKNEWIWLKVYFIRFYFQYLGLVNNFGFFDDQ